MMYPKIETLYVRDEKTHKVSPERIRCPEFSLVTRWLITEKIDGTNTRVMLSDDGSVRFGGRTDKAQVPTHLLDKLQETFPAEKVAAAFDPGTNAVIFGEGYGPKINSGGGYTDEVSFRVFDVTVLTPSKVWWLRWDDVTDIARKLGVDTVPVLNDACTFPLQDMAAFLGGVSVVASEESGDEFKRNAEGIVARTEPMLFDRTGRRVMWKLKVKDF